MSVAFDEIAQQYFETPEQLSEALDLLSTYQHHVNLVNGAGNWGLNYAHAAGLNEFYDSLTAEQRKLLDGAAQYDKQMTRAQKYGWNSAQSAESQDASAERIIDAINNREVDKLISIKLSEVFDLFLTEKSKGWKADNNFRRKYENEIFPVFLEVVGDKETRKITKQDINQYKSAVFALPAYREQRYKGVPIAELMDIDFAPGEKLSKTSVGNYLSRISGFLDWCMGEDYVIPGINSSLKNASPISGSSEDEERDAYSKSDLKKLFNSRQYTQGKHKEDWQFWIPLIALFTGARQNEIAQLFLSDIYQEEGTALWVFDFNQRDSEKSLKSIKKGEHARLVPIHSKLIELGFLDFLETKKGQERLFGGLKYHPVNKYARRVSKWWNDTYTNASNCDITDTKKVFHSLRHTLETHLHNDKDVSPNRIAVICGQKPDGKVTARRYIKKTDIENRHRDINRADFSDCIDFDAICAWQRQLFFKK